LDFNKRLKIAIRNALQYYAIVVIAALLGLWLLTEFNLYKMNGDFELLVFVKSIANAWGITLIMILLGYSLVTIPRSW